MSELESTQEAVAQVIAAAGYDALVERLRGAYAEAAAANADVVSVAEERIDALVQAAADRADGLQWRRALATVAVQELQIDLTEALSHPAVVRAQELVGAPSYEQCLEELVARPVPGPGGTSAGNHQPDEPAAPAVIPGQEELFQEGPVDDPYATVEHDVSFDAEEPLGDLAPESSADELKRLEDRLKNFEQFQQTDNDEPLRDADEPLRDADEPLQDGEEGDLRLSAHHLGGVANLPTGPHPLSLRLSPAGLDILGEQDAIIGRLGWEEIDEFETPPSRGGLFRRDKERAATLTVRTQHGDASFEVPAFSSEELWDRLEPLIAKYGRH